MKISSIVWCEIFLVLVLSPLVVLGLPVVQRPKLVSVGTAVTSLKNKLQSHHPFQLFDKRYSTQLLLAAKDGADYGAGSFLTRSAFFKLLGGGIFSFPLLLELYSRVGSFGVKLSQDNLKPPDTGTWNDVEHATIVFHGAGGQDQYTDALMERLSSQSASSSDKSKYYSTMIEWSEYSSNILQASFNGAELGRQVATKLLENAPNLKTIHLIGISVGSFAADAAGARERNHLLLPLSLAVITVFVFRIFHMFVNLFANVRLRLDSGHHFVQAEVAAAPRRELHGVGIELVVVIP